MQSIEGPADAICSAREREMTDVPETRWARTVDGACIAYQDLGSGPITLLVVHGWVSHLEVYWEQPRYVRFLQRLSRNLRVLVFDKRGVGMSDRVSGSPDLGTLLDDVRAVMDAADVEKAALLRLGRARTRTRRVLRRHLPRPDDLSRTQRPASLSSGTRLPLGFRASSRFETDLSREPQGMGKRRRRSRFRPRGVRRSACRRFPAHGSRLPQVEREARPLRRDARELRGIRAYVVRDGRPPDPPHDLRSHGCLLLRR